MPEYIPAILLQNSRNGNPGIPADENSSQTNADSHYSNYSYSGLIANELALYLERSRRQFLEIVDKYKSQDYMSSLTRITDKLKKYRQ